MYPFFFTGAPTLIRFFIGERGDVGEGCERRVETGTTNLQAMYVSCVANVYDGRARQEG